MEAMAAGKPIIVSQANGLAEALKDGETALLVPARSPEAIAHAARRLMEDPAVAAHIGHAAGDDASVDRLGRAGCRHRTRAIKLGIVEGHGTGVGIVLALLETGLPVPHRAVIVGLHAPPGPAGDLPGIDVKPGHRLHGRGGPVGVAGKIAPHTPVGVAPVGSVGVHFAAVVNAELIDVERLRRCGRA